MPPKKRRFPWLLFFTALFSIWFTWASLNPALPQKDSAPILYSNQCRQDIKATLLTAIQGAKKSIHLVMFGLSDSSMLHTLSQKIHEHVPTTIFYDVGGSPKIFKYLKGGDIHPIKNPGLMHQKILVLDHEMVFIGSANMTSASLKMHDNLVIGLMSKDLALFLETHKPYTPGYFQTHIKKQQVELWLLPDPRGHSLASLRKMIRNASHTIQIALFTFTHEGLIDELIDAQKRGVQISIVVDKYSGIGASAKAIELLKKAKIPVRLSQGIQLLHHKFIYIDENTLVTGSANWTKAAFYKNSDCIIALHNLNKTQKRFMKTLWNSIETATTISP